MKYLAANCHVYTMCPMHAKSSLTMYYLIAYMSHAAINMQLSSIDSVY